MKRRKLSVSTIPQEGFQTPTKSATKRPRFVTPFKTPLRNSGNSSNAENTPTSCKTGPRSSKFTEEKSDDLTTSNFSPSPSPNTSTSKTTPAISSPFSKCPTSSTPAKSPHIFKTPTRTFSTPVSANTPMRDYLRNRKLEKEIGEKESLLRKFRLVKRARESGEIGRLTEFVNEWRSVSQETLCLLLKRAKDMDSSMNLGKVVEQLGIDHDMVRYDQDNDDFRE